MYINICKVISNVSIIELLSHRLQIFYHFVCYSFHTSFNLMIVFVIRIQTNFLQWGRPFLRSICSTISSSGIWFVRNGKWTVRVLFNNLLVSTWKSTFKNNMFRTETIYLTLKRPLDCWLEDCTMWTPTCWKEL